MRVISLSPEIIAILGGILGGGFLLLRNRQLSKRNARLIDENRKVTAQAKRKEGLHKETMSQVDQVAEIERANDKSNAGSLGELFDMFNRVLNQNRPDKD